MSLQQLASKDLSRFLSDAHFVQLHDVIIIYIAQEVLALLPDSTVREKERILMTLDISFLEYSSLEIQTRIRTTLESIYSYT